LQTISELVKRVDFLRGGPERATTSEADLLDFMGSAPDHAARS